MDITFDTCRICLGKQNLCSIFKECDIPISEKIAYCAAVQVFQDDYLPKMICSQCLSYLDVAYVFKTVCEETDKKLRDLQLTNQIGDFDDTASDSEEFLFNEIENESDKLEMDFINLPKNKEKTNYDIDKSSIEKDIKMVTSDILAENCNAERKSSSHKFYSSIHKHNIEERGHENVADIFKKEGIYELSLLKNSDDNSGQSEYIPHIPQLCSKKLIYLNEEKNRNKYKNSSVINSVININSSKSSDMHEVQDEENIIVDNTFSTADNTCKENAKDKVGRHIAKKITGKYPQKLYQNIKMAEDKQLLSESFILHDVNLDIKCDSAETIENILEEDMPVVVSEVTVITNNQGFHDEAPNDSKNVERENIHEHNIREDKIYNMTTTSEERAKKISTCKLSMTLRKGNRKVNIFNDHAKHVKRKQRLKKIKKQLKNMMDDVTYKKKKEAFKCDVCKKAFSFRSHLNRHLNMHTGIKQYTCQYCNQKFINSYNLSVHVLKHTGEFPLKCELCNKGFPSPSLLKRHMTCHTGETHYQCRYCSAKFTQSSSLKLHERMHLHRPSYHCDVCYKVFSYTNSLAAHKKLHYSANRFSCDVCVSTFSRKSSLVRHMDGHIKSKKIKCRFCDLTFLSTVNYYSHLKTHCKYKCESCGEGFRNKITLINHIKKHNDSV